MTEKNGWKKFFDNHAPYYLEESFTKNTKTEVDFLEEELDLSQGSSILDVGCGTGRHALELSRRGYQVTGLDISEKMLKEGRKVNKSEGLKVKFIQADAVNFSLDCSFDAGICLCEGAFGLLSETEDPGNRDQKILNNIYSVLKPGSKIILTVLNGLRMIRKYEEEDIEKGKFDPINIIEINNLSEILENSTCNSIIKEKGFVPTEIYQMFKKSGFTVENIWGGTAGQWNRERLKMDEMEMMITGLKI